MAIDSPSMGLLKDGIHLKASIRTWHSKLRRMNSRAPLPSLKQAIFEF